MISQKHATVFVFVFLEIGLAPLIPPNLLSPDTVGRSLKVIIPPGLHKWNVQSLGHRLYVVAGEGGGGTEDGRHSGLDELTQLLARLEAVVLRVPAQNIAACRVSALLGGCLAPTWLHC